MKNLKKVLKAGKKKIVKVSRAFAYFLRKFPGYTVETLLEEYASRFYILLEQSFRIDAQERLEDIQILGIPNYKHQEDAKRIIDSYYKQVLDKDDMYVDDTIVKQDSQKLMSILGIKQQ